ncbi:hypothetical protein [Cupriavidus sp. CuC1]|uniref:hypothetical protein n=1 Tax=Cupriavidus sp. CuC1 TaxID=3373131 RepID=UPI0037CDBD1B
MAFAVSLLYDTLLSVERSLKPLQVRLRQFGSADLYIVEGSHLGIVVLTTMNDSESGVRLACLKKPSQETPERA